MSCSTLATWLFFGSLVPSLLGLCAWRRPEVRNLLFSFASGMVVSGLIAL